MDKQFKKGQINEIEQFKYENDTLRKHVEVMGKYVRQGRTPGTDIVRELEMSYNQSMNQATRKITIEKSKNMVNMSIIRQLLGYVYKRKADPMTIQKTTRKTK